MKRTFLFCFFAVFVLAGCSHIPLTTMVKMSGFDEEDFVQIDPENIRAKITTNIPAKFVEKGTELNFKLISPEYKIDKTVPLTIISDNLSTESHWFGDNTLKHITIFKLSESGLKDFNEVQQLPQIKKRPKDSKFKVTVRWDFDDPEVKQYTISVDLLLLPEDGYFTLFEDLELTRGESKEL